MADRNGTALATMSESERQYQDTILLLQERIQELEQDEVGWQRLSLEGDREFSRDGLKSIAALSRLMFLRNPLINRAVTLQAFYVFGQGVSIRHGHPDVNAVVQAFLDDRHNRAELTGHQARTLKEQELAVEGNLFLALFTAPATGRVRVRAIPASEVAEIVCNPEDAREVWYYRREWMERRTDPATGQPRTEQRKAHYPDWQYRPKARPSTFGGAPILWDAPVYHLKVGGLPDMRFGVPETYQALDWALAYKRFLENVATIMAALSRFAAKVTTKGGAAGVAAAKAKFGTTVGTTEAESNPPPVAGSLFIGSQGVSLDPFQARGANVDPEDGRRLLLMVAAAVGMPETFFGDMNTSNLATAKSLDRPTELKFIDRRTLWGDAYSDLCDYVIEQAVRAPKGKLQGRIVPDDDGEMRVELDATDADGKPADPTVDVAWPPILEHDPEQGVKAISQAATLGGAGVLAGTLDAKLTTRLLLQALGVPDVDAEMDRLFPEGEQPALPPPHEQIEPPAEEAALREAERSALPGVATALEAVAAGLKAVASLRQEPPVVNVSLPAPETPLPAAVIDPAPVLEAARRLEGATATMQEAVRALAARPEPAPPAPTVIQLPARRTVRKEVQRDATGAIVAVVEEEAP